MDKGCMMLVDLDDATLERLVAQGVLDGAVIRRPISQHTPPAVAVEFRFYQRGRKEILTELTDELEEMERVGYDMAVVHREILRSDRDRSERFFMLKARLAKPRPSTDRLAGSRAFLSNE